MKWAIIMAAESVTVGLAFVLPAYAKAPLNVEARLVAERRVFIPGDRFRVGAYLKIPPGAHIYWINPGEAGWPTRIQWILPEGFESGPTEWPVPARFVSPPIVSHGYADEVLIYTTVRAPAKLGGVATFRFHAKVEWLLCREKCVPNAADLALALRVGERRKDSAEDVELFRRFEPRMPKENPDWKFEFAENERHVVLFAKPPSSWPERKMTRLVFIPVIDDLTDPAAPQTWRRTTDQFALSLPKTARRHTAGNYLEGVLREGDGIPYSRHEWFTWVRAAKRAQDSN